MTNERNSVIMAPANLVKTVAPVKEETEMLRATEKITALYCRLSQEDERLSSPEDLTGYLRVTSPGMWIVLSGWLAKCWANRKRAAF